MQLSWVSVKVSAKTEIMRGLRFRPRGPGRWSGTRDIRVRRGGGKFGG